MGIGALKTAPKSWKKGAAVAVSGLWVYARKPPPTDVQQQTQGQEQEQPGVTAAHVCDPQTGVDSKHGQCLRVAACDKAAPGQQFERFPCSHWADRSDTDGVPLPTGKYTSNPPLLAMYRPFWQIACESSTFFDRLLVVPEAECLSHRLASGQRNWLNAELWGAATCQVLESIVQAI